jgi:heterodisulfide reductase subunit C
VSSSHVQASEASERPSGADVSRPTVLSARIFALADYRRQDFSVCLGCKICASVCTINDLGVTANPQDLLVRLFLGQDVQSDDPVVRNCVSCYRCTDACPWRIRIPEVARACREEFAMAGTFEKAFKDSVRIWGRVYEPYVMLRAAPFLLKEGYVRYAHKWMEYAGLHLLHLPGKVKRGRS